MWWWLYVRSTSVTQLFNVGDLHLATELHCPWQRCNISVCFRDSTALPLPGAPHRRCSHLDVCALGIPTGCHWEICSWFRQWKRWSRQNKTKNKEKDGDLNNRAAHTMTSWQLAEQEPARVVEMQHDTRHVRVASSFPPNTSMCLMPPCISFFFSQTHTPTRTAMPVINSCNTTHSASKQQNP